MVGLDRLVSYSRIEEREVEHPTAPPFSRNYQGISTQSPDSGLSAGRAAIITGDGPIVEASEAADATAVYLSVRDTNGETLPEQFPPDRMEITTGGNGYRFMVKEARHPEGRDRYNRGVTHTDTWRLSVNMVMQIGSGLAGFGVWSLKGMHVSRPVLTTTLVTYRLWARRFDLGPRAQLAVVADTTIVPVEQAVWRFRNYAGAVVPDHDTGFTDDEGQTWRVFGHSEVGSERRRFADLLCRNIIDQPG